MEALDGINIAFITESWLTECSGHVIHTIKGHGFNIHRTDRAGRGGGIAVLYREVECLSLDIPRHVSSSLTSFEHHVIRLTTPLTTYCIICIYRRQEIPIRHFLDEIDTLLDHVMNTLKDTIIVLGDFNVHFDVLERRTIDVIHVFQNYQLGAVVTEPTHIHGHTLDQIFYNKDTLDLPEPSVYSDLKDSDHFPTFFTLPYSIDNNKLEKAKEVINFRKLKQVDIPAFRQTVIENLKPWYNRGSRHDDFLELCTGFKKGLQLALDHHAPLLTMRLAPKPTLNPQWFDDEYIQERRKRRSLERRYRRNKTAENRQSLSEQRDKCCALARMKREDHTRQMIGRCKGNQKELFKCISKLLDKQKTSILPDHKGNPEQLAEDFNKFYIDKVTRTREAITSKPSRPVILTPHPTASSENVSRLYELRPATAKEIRDIIRDMTIKTSPADPIPATLLKEIIDDLTPHVLMIVNASLAAGSLDGLKESIITPILKKRNLDINKLNNYRPIANIEFLSKLTEKVVLSRLNEHMVTNNLHTPQQFGYKKGHSTEHVILEIVDEVLIGFEKGTATLVTLLDLSAAFDTVDLEKLMHILENHIHTKGTALAWFRSFLFGRHQRVKVGSTTSDLLATKYGVPQGSVLGPVLFNIYIRDLPSFISSFGFDTSSYADDTNTRLKFSLQFQYHNIKQRLPQLLKDLESWMDEHFLKLNPDKTEIILFTPDSSKKLIGLMHPYTGHIRFKNSVNLLGVNLDDTLTLEPHVNNVISSSYYHLREIGKLRRYLSSEDLLTLTHSVISAKLDYCNVIMFGLHSRLIENLQKVQNAAARFIFKLPKRSSVRDVIRKLHWLRVEQRVVYKILLTVYKRFYCTCPGFLYSLLEISNSETMSLKCTYYNTRHGKRAFRYTAPRLWNRLPSDMRKIESLETFKRNLKTYLFDHTREILNALSMYME